MQSDYFVLMRALCAQHPLLSWDQSAMDFRRRTPVLVDEPIKLCLGDPVPANLVMADHHSLPEPVVSTRFKAVLEELDLHGVQLVPADVEVKGDVLRYWLVHMWKRLACMDMQRSVYKFSKSGHVIRRLDHLVLDEKLLRAIPLKERLVFALDEAVVFLFHRDAMERVLAMTPPPEGVRFVPVSEWNISSEFR